MRLAKLFVGGAVILLAQSFQGIENDQVKVVRAIDQAHKKGQPHDHKVNRVMIYLNAGRQEITPQGGKPQSSSSRRAK
jgi:hypothetical protein